MKTLLILTSSLFLLNACSTPPSHASQESIQTQTKQMHEKHVNAKQAQQLLASSPQVKVIDVRTPKEFSEGHIENAMNIDFKSPTFSKQLSKVDKSTPYLIHCRSGNRSTQSLATFKELEFDTVYHLDGGIKAWDSAKLPTVQ